MTFGFYAIIFFSLKMLTLPDINHNVPLCWLLVIGRKGVSSCATDTARLWRQASTRSTLLIPFNWILFINCFCFMGGGRGKGNSMRKISISKGSVERKIKPCSTLICCVTLGKHMTLSGLSVPIWTGKGLESGMQGLRVGRCLQVPHSHTHQPSGTECSRS